MEPPSPARAVVKGSGVEEKSTSSPCSAEGLARVCDLLLKNDPSQQQSPPLSSSLTPPLPSQPPPKRSWTRRRRRRQPGVESGGTNCCSSSESSCGGSEEEEEEEEEDEDEEEEEEEEVSEATSTAHLGPDPSTPATSVTPDSEADPNFTKPDLFSLWGSNCQHCSDLC